MNFLQGRIFGLPIWLVGIVAVGGGLGLYLIIKRRNGGSSSSGGALGQNTSNATPDPNIDPNTGAPYAVEEATDPNTGLPVYLTLLNQGNGMAGAGAGTNSPAGPVGPPQPGGSPPAPPGPVGPPIAPPVTPTVTTGVTTGVGQVVNPQAGRGGGPKGPPQGIPQPSGTPLQGGGKFRGTGFPGVDTEPAIRNAPSAFTFQATEWWPQDLRIQPWHGKHPWPAQKGL